MHLIAQALGVERGPSEFSEGVRVAALRKLLEAHFGAAQAWQAMNELWRSAPASPGVLEVNVDQSHCTPGAWECPRSCRPGAGNSIMRLVTSSDCWNPSAAGRVAESAFAAL
jgi:hypothetical protein